MVILYEEIWGAFHSTKIFENLETAANGTEISRKSYQKFRKLMNFRNANHSTENSRNSGIKVVWKENFQEKTFENLGIPRKAVLFFGNFGKCCSIHHRKLPKIQTERLGWTESALALLDRFNMMSQRPCGCSKKWNGGRVGEPSHPCGSSALFLWKNVHLFQYISVDAGHVSENAP